MAELTIKQIPDILNAEFAPGIRILGPEKVRRAYRRHLRRAAGT